MDIRTSSILFFVAALSFLNTVHCLRSIPYDKIYLKYFFDGDVGKYDYRIKIKSIFSGIVSLLIFTACAIALYYRLRAH